MSCADGNWIGAASNSPIAAATRSGVRVAAYPICAALSASLRSLLLEALASAPIRVFFLNGPHGWPCAAYRRAHSSLYRSRELHALLPTGLVLCSVLPASAPAPNALSAEQKNPCCPTREALSHTASR